MTQALRKTEVQEDDQETVRNGRRAPVERSG
jgi:hypothetical protein